MQTESDRFVQFWIPSASGGLHPHQILFGMGLRGIHGASTMGQGVGGLRSTVVDAAAMIYMMLTIISQDMVSSLSDTLAPARRDVRFLPGQRGW